MPKGKLTYKQAIKKAAEYESERTKMIKKGYVPIRRGTTLYYIPEKDFLKSAKRIGRQRLCQKPNSQKHKEV